MTDIPCFGFLHVRMKFVTILRSWKEFLWLNHLHISVLMLRFPNSVFLYDSLHLLSHSGHISATSNNYVIIELQVWEGNVSVNVKWETSNAVIHTVCGNDVHGLEMTC